MNSRTQSNRAHAVSPFVISLYFVIVFLSTTASSSHLTWQSLKQTIRQQYPTVEQLTTQTLAGWFQDSDKTHPIVLDVRKEVEYRVSHLKGAQWTPNIASALKVLSTSSKNSVIVVYCSVGYRSSALAAELQKNGYKNVKNLEGSIFQWRNEGRPIYSNGKPAFFVHPYDDEWGRLLDSKYHAAK